MKNNNDFRNLKNKLTRIKSNNLYICVYCYINLDSTHSIVHSAKN